MNIIELLSLHGKNGDTDAEGVMLQARALIEYQQAEIERLRVSEQAWKIIARQNDRWNELPQSEREAALHKGLDEATAELMQAEEQIERLRANEELQMQRAIRAEAEIERLRAEREWRPIETAPTDRRVLVCVAEIPQHRRVIALKSKQELWLDEKLQPMIYPPSYWMPLPAPPEGT